MPWWGWMILGLFLLGSELLIVDAAFFLVFVGAAALVTGGVVLSGVVTEPWLQWLLFSGLALIAMMFFRKRLYEQLRSTGTEYKDGLAGEILRLESALAPGESCRQSFRGTDWTVINRGSEPLEAATDVRIDGTDGLNIILTGQTPVN